MGTQRQLKCLGLAAIMSAIALIIGCSTSSSTAVSKKKLELQTRMSSSVFLEPIHANKRSVFVQLHNASEREGLDLEPQLLAALAEKGYEVVSRPDQAQYLLQANVLQLGKMDLAVTESALRSGFGATWLGGGAPGVLEGSANQLSGPSAVALGETAGEASSRVSLASAAVLQPVYAAVLDVQISERVGNSIVIREKSPTRLKAGLKGPQEITSTEKIAWKRYQTRIISTALPTKANVKLERVTPHLVQGLSRSIAGIF